MPTFGKEGMGWTPFMLSLFFFIFLLNIFEVIPIFQLPGNARIAMPMFLAWLVWVCFIVVGIKIQGPSVYFKNTLCPPGVPVARYLLVTPIEFVSVFLV